MPNSNSTQWDEYLLRMLDAIINGRIEARTMREMTPEQRDEYFERLVAEDKANIAEAKELHETAPKEED